MKLAVLAALGAAAVILLVPSVASASPYIQYGVQDDAYLSAGPSLDSRLDTLDRMGAKLVRYTVNWRQIAPKRPTKATNPGDPAYDWTNAEAVLNGLHKHRIAVLITLYGTPAWANGGRKASGVPTSTWSLAAFAPPGAPRAPGVRQGGVGDEANRASFLNPNSPVLYVQRLLNPTYASLHALNRANRVAGGATSPRPTPSGMSPVAFMRGMRAARPRMDAYSHHPYPVTRRERPNGFYGNACRYCRGVLTMTNLPLLLQEVRRDFGAKRIWLTEYGYQTNPPDPSGVSRAVQAQYLAEAALRARDARFVDVLVNFMVEDETRLAGWQSGLLTASGAAKPSFNSFMLPIAQAGRTGQRTTIWGHVRTGFGKRAYRLQRLASGRWVNVGASVLTNLRGSYTRVVRAAPGTRFRVLWLPSRTPSRTIVIH